MQPIHEFCALSGRGVWKLSTVPRLEPLLKMLVAIISRKSRKTLFLLQIACNDMAVGDSIHAGKGIPRGRR